MGFLSVIRRWALREGMPIREIARRTGLSRNTIKKYLREGAVEPKFKVPKRPSNLDPYADRLSAWLLAQTRKSRKERRTVKQMHADLVKLGYDSNLVKRSNSTGAKTGPLSVANGSSFRWPIRNSRTAGQSCCARIHYRHTRCCSMPIGMRSACSVVCPDAVSTIT